MIKDEGLSLETQLKTDLNNHWITVVKNAWKNPWYVELIVIIPWFSLVAFLNDAFVTSGAWFALSVFF